MRRLLRFAPVLAAACTLSCADMPTAPRSIVAVTGQITNRDGTGIEQAYVTFESLDPRDRPIIFSSTGTRRSPATHSIQTVTDGSGKYRVLVPEGPYEVYISPRSGYPQVRLPSVTFTSGQTNEVNYRYGGVKVTGSITGPGGIALGSGGMVAFGSDYITSDLEAGRYSLLVPAGTYSLVAFGRTSNIAFPSVRWSGVSLVADTTIDVVLEGVQVTGRITGQEGEPLYHIRIEAIGVDDYLEAYTEADGVYTLYARPGVYTFNVRPWDYQWLAGRQLSSVNVAGAMTLDFDLSGVEWDGTVRRTSDSTVVEDARVRGYAIDGGYFYVQDRTDALGAFHLVVEPGLIYEVNVLTSSHDYPIGQFKATADTTFTFYVDVPPLP